jgi:ferritin-like metal-binding protein YciE
MTTITRLDDLFYDMLKDIYYAERKILKALPKMIKAVGRESKLGEAFEKHFEETEGQIERLEEVFESIGQKAKGETCQAIEGITEEAQDLMHEVDCKATLEAGLLAGAQAVEHYEIARYGTLVEWAKLLGHAHAVKLLEQTLAQEKKTDDVLNKLALHDINRRALESFKETKNPAKHAHHRQAA